MNTKPNYTTNDPRGWGGNRRFGAALGRRKLHAEPRDYSGKLTLRRIRLDVQGYDPNGTYFGLGLPLYWYVNDEGTIDAVLRAKDRNDAKALIRQRHYPNARFYR